MTEQWQELKETITEMRDNDGTSTQQENCDGDCECCEYCDDVKPYGK